MTAAPTLQPVPHPGVDPVSVASALLRVMHLGCVHVVQVPAAELGSCLSCPEAPPVPPSPAVAVLAHRASDDEASWLYRDPLCEQHLVTEVRLVLASGHPLWVEKPRVVIDA